MTADIALYDRVGGRAFFDALVDRFYEGVGRDPLLRPMYPDDLGPAKSRLAGFLVQYWGGPEDYSAERGHPRLRMRHAPFAIASPERDAWLGHMESAVAASGAGEREVAELLAYFRSAATFLINREG